MAKNKQKEIKSSALIEKFFEFRKFLNLKQT